MTNLEFDAGYLWMGLNDPAKPDTHSEAGFERREKAVSIPIEQCGFVVLDVWEMDKTAEKYPWIPGSPMSIRERMNSINWACIKPALDAARKANIPVIHAPSYYISVRQPQYKALREEMKAAGFKHSPPKERTWPPQEEAAKVHSEVFSTSYGEGADDINHHRVMTSGIHAAVAPVDGEAIIGDFDDLDYVCERDRITTLFYVGFCTNMCIMEKAGGLRDTHVAGYKTFLLRDCTTGMEFGDTTASLQATAVHLSLIETTWAWTLDSDAFIRACGAAAGEG